MKKIISGIVALFAVVIMIYSNFSIGQIKVEKSIARKTNENEIVLLELFTSQGCSSCPPADKILSKYALGKNPNIIPLAFHVDYWNYIGWKDPFSKPEYSERQKMYAKYFNLNGIYTPQLVINGTHELVGSQEIAIEKIIKEQSSIKVTEKVQIDATFSNQNNLVVSYSVPKSGNKKTFTIVLVKKKEFTSISRGENKGLQQTSYNIVYDLKNVIVHNKLDDQVTFNFQSSWLPSDFMLVAFLQDNSNGKIYSATKKEVM